MLNHLIIFRFFLLLLLIAILFGNCVDAVSFDRKQEDFILVVDGKVNLQDSVQTLLLSRTAVVGRSAQFPPETGALVFLLENGERVSNYVETAPGEYKISGFKPQIGNTYQVDVTLKSGRSYMSQPEVMPSGVPIDSAYFTYNGDRTLTLYSQVAIPEQENPPYLRWRLRHVYQHSDLHCGGLDAVTTCYYELRRSTDNQLVPLLDGGELAGGSTVQFPIVSTLVVDSIFGEVSYYTIYQETLTPTAFQYWEKVNNLLTQTGSIFDAPPGQIRGNIYDVEAPEALVLGIFYAASEDIAYVKTIPTDFLPLQVNPFCGAPGFPPNPFPFPECCYCPFGIPKPDYWQ